MVTSRVYDRPRPAMKSTCRGHLRYCSDPLGHLAPPQNRLGRPGSIASARRTTGRRKGSRVCDERRVAVKQIKVRRNSATNVRFGIRHVSFPESPSAVVSYRAGVPLTYLPPLPPRRIRLWLTPAICGPVPILVTVEAILYVLVVLLNAAESVDSPLGKGFVLQV